MIADITMETVAGPDEENDVRFCGIGGQVRVAAPQRRRVAKYLIIIEQRVV